MNFRDRLRCTWVRYGMVTLCFAPALSASYLHAENLQTSTSLSSDQPQHFPPDESTESSHARAFVDGPEDPIEDPESLSLLNEALRQSTQLSRLALSPSVQQDMTKVVDQDGQTYQLERIPIGLEPLDVKLLRQTRQARDDLRNKRLVKVIIAVDEDDSRGRRYAEEQLAEVTQTLAALQREDGITRKLVVVRVPQSELANFREDWKEILTHLKEQKLDPNTVEKIDAAIKGSRYGAYWKRIYATPLKEEIQRGLLAGTLLQAFITAATEYFLLYDKKVPAEIMADAALIGLYGGVLGIYNTTYRNFRNIPANWESSSMRALSTLGLTPSFAKALANSGLFSIIMTVNKVAFQEAYGHGDGLDAFSLTEYALFATVFNLAAHCVLSQFARVYYESIVNIREKYGWISSKTSYLQSQIAIFGTYLVFRLGHLYYREFWQKAAETGLTDSEQMSIYNDIVGNYIAPMLPYGLAAMTATGLLAHAGYRWYLTKVAKTGKRYLAAVDPERSEIILTEIPVNFADLKEFKPVEFKPMHKAIASYVPAVVQQGKNIVKAAYGTCMLAFGAQPNY